MKIVVPIGVFTITRSMTGERLSSTSAQPSRNSCNKNKSNNKRKIRKIRKTTLKFYEIFIYLLSIITLQIYRSYLAI